MITHRYGNAHTFLFLFFTKDIEFHNVMHLLFMHLVFIFLLFYVFFFYDNMIYSIQHAPYILCIMENGVWMSVRKSNQYEAFILFIFFPLCFSLFCFAISSLAYFMLENGWSGGCKSFAFFPLFKFAI